MYRFKYIVTLLWALAMLPGCSKGPKKVLFSTQHSLTPGFVAQVFAMDAKDKNRREDSAVAIRVYKSVFLEERVENNDVLEFALRNQARGNQSVPYLPLSATYRQVLYLMHITGRKTHDLWAYCSVWYARDTQQIDYGPAYGGYDDGAGNITFCRSMSMQAAGSKLYLKRGGTSDFLFATDSLARDTIRVKKIVISEPNKIGGIRPFVFQVSDHFRDLAYLPFAYDTTLNFNLRP